MSDFIIPTPRKVFDDIEGFSQQMQWHADMLKMAARQYTGDLNLYGLLEIMISMAKQLDQTYDKLQDMAWLPAKLSKA